MQSPRPLLATDASQRTCLRRQRVGLQGWCHARNGAFAVERPAHHSEQLNRAHSSHGWRGGRCVAPFRRAQCQLPLTTALHLDGSLQISTGCLQPGQPVVVEASRRYGRRVGCAADGDDPEQRLQPASQRHGAVAPKARFGSGAGGVALPADDTHRRGAKTRTRRAVAGATTRGTAGLGNIYQNSN